MKKYNLPIYNNPNFNLKLIDARNKANSICHRYNQLTKENTEEKKTLLKMLLGKLGKNINIEPDFWCDYGYNIEIGDNFHSNSNLTILDGAKVVIGDNVVIGSNCGFYTAGKPIDILIGNKKPLSSDEIVVGNDVWIGGNVVIIGGVKIGDGAVIGAGSVITTDVPPHYMAYGNPCKIVKNTKQKHSTN